MARAATTADAFNAVAEPRRRQILDALAGGERPVNELVHLLGLAQPQVSKHLRVLREVGAVNVRDEGRQRLYRLNGNALRPIHDWVKNYERTWTERFEQLDVVLEELKEEGIHFLSLDPGDLDTPMHALAVPDADPALLKRPELAAREFIERIGQVLSPRAKRELVTEERTPQ